MSTNLATVEPDGADASVLRAALLSPDDAQPAPAPAAPPPAAAARPAFGAFLGGARRGGRRVRRVTVVVSVLLHLGVLGAALVHSFWHVEALSVPAVGVKVSFVAAAPPPPPPPAAARAATAKPRPVTRPARVQPQAVVVPPPPAPAEEAGAEDGTDEGSPAGISGGQAGGVETGAIGGVPEAPAPPPPPPPKPALTEAQRQTLKERYLNEVLRPRIAQRMRYPEEAVPLEIEGVVLVSARIDATGRLVEARVAGACLHDILCDDALRTMRAAAPFPAPPAELAGSPIEVPLRYRLN